MAKIEYVKQALAKGLSVFPVVWTDEAGICSCGDIECKHRGKHPLPGSSGFKDATTDIMQVERWWKLNPDANYGIHPGEKFIVVDLDVKGSKGVNGIEMFSKWLGIEEWEITDLTFTVETTTGGLHLYFKTDTPFSDKIGLLPGVDIRAQVGYVVGWGSSIGAKSYNVVNDVDFEDVPERLKLALNAVRKKSEKPTRELDTPGAIDRAVDFLKKRKPAIEGQGGNNHTYATAAQVKDVAVSEEKCLELMLEHWNERCEPPWSEIELSGVIHNAYNYGKDAPGSKGSNDMDKFLEANLDAQDISEILEKDKNDRFAKFRQNFYAGDASRRLERNYDFIAYGFIPAQGYTALLSDRGVGKSTIALDVAMRLATDMDWHDDIPLAKGWSVVYIVGEDMEGVIMRQNAWCKRHNRTLPNERWNVLDMSIDFNDEEEVVTFAEFLREKYSKETKVLFVLDTWQRMSAGAEGGQNDDVAMQRAIRHAEWLAKTFNGPSIIAFHPPKNNKGTIMGSSVLENNSHAIMNVTSQNGLRIIETIRIKGCPMGDELHLGFDTVKYEGQNNLGIDNSGPVPVFKGRKGGKVSEDQKLKDDAVLWVICDMLGHTGELDDPSAKGTLTYNIASKAIRRIPEMAERDDTPDFWRSWKKNLDRVEWVYEANDITQENKSQTYRTIKRLLPDSTNVNNPISVTGTSFGLYVLQRKSNGATEIHRRDTGYPVNSDTGEIEEVTF